jgi:DNA-binding response OmpR family regulator
MIDSGLSVALTVKPDKDIGKRSMKLILKYGTFDADSSVTEPSEYCGNEDLAAALTTDYDAIVLDVMLP